MKSGTYITLIALTLFLIPILLLLTIGLGFAHTFQSEAELVLFLFYNGPLWLLFLLVIGLELYRTSVLGKQTGGNLIYAMTAGGAALGITGLLISPVGPGLWTLSGLSFIVISATICGVMAQLIQLLRWQQQRKQ